MIWKNLVSPETNELKLMKPLDVPQPFVLRTEQCEPSLTNPYRRDARRRRRIEATVALNDAERVALYVERATPPPPSSGPCPAQLSE